MPSRSIFRDVRLDLRLGQAAMAERLDINRCYLSELENGREASPELIKKLQDIAQSAAGGMRRPRSGASVEIPIIAWARAGTAASYEEIPPDWQTTVSSDCPDSRAFGLTLEGDSMEPKYSQGDVVIVMPQMRARPNALVVANIVDQGVVFKMFTPRPNQHVQLSSYNAAYPPIEVAETELAWVYPAYEIRRRVW